MPGVAGAVQVTAEPDPVMEPAVAVQVKVSGLLSRSSAVQYRVVFSPVTTGTGDAARLLMRGG